MIAYATRCDCDTKFALYPPGFPVCVFKLLTSIFSISLSLYECVTLLFPQSSRIPWRAHTLTAHNARGYMTTRDPARGSAGVRVSERYRFDARGPTTHGAAHAAVPSRLLCIYSNYVTSRIHCSPHHCAAEAAESRRVWPNTPESAATARMARRPSSPPRPVTCRFVFSFAAVPRSRSSERECASRGIVVRSDFRVAVLGDDLWRTTVEMRRASLGDHARRSSLGKNVRRANCAAPNDGTFFKNMEAQCDVPRELSHDVSSECPVSFLSSSACTCMYVFICVYVSAYSRFLFRIERSTRFPIRDAFALLALVNVTVSVVMQTAKRAAATTRLALSSGYGTTFDYIKSA